MIKIPENTNRLLERQLKRIFPDGNFDIERVNAFIKLVNSAYQASDENRVLDDRAIKISSTELEEANKALQAKNDFLDTFNHGMAHDIKNHTSNIIGLLSMLRKYHAKNNTEMVNTIVDKLDLSSNQLTSIVQGFLYLSRAEVNIESQYTIIQKEEIIKAVEIETLFLTIGKQSNINYNFKIENLFYSPHILKIIFVNLISNSLKFSKKDSPLRIDVNLSHTQNRIELSVEDNGIGMDLTDPHNKIFELFNRTESTKMVKGTGVGLFMIKKIIDRQQGTVEIQSEPNKGTKFLIKLSLNKTV